MISKATFLATFTLLFISIVTPAAKAAMFGEKRIELHTAASSYLLFVQLAETKKALTQGLMERESLLPYNGMLFDFGMSQPVAMWMKNTPMRLDMIFIKEDGIIAHIEEETTPYSTAPISYAQPVRYVLEMQSGGVKHYNITIGDRIQIP